MTDEVRSRSVDRPPEAKESDISSQKTETPSREDKARARRKSTFIGLRKTKVLQKYFSCFLDKQSTRLERPELFLVEYPMKRMTVAFMLFIVAALLYFQGLKYLSNYHGITTITAALTLAFGFLILSVVTVDTLEVSKRDRTMQFQRKGLFRYEQKTFKFNQIKGLVIGNENKRCSMKTISIYRLQATLITNGRAELFRSYSKRHIRESYVLLSKFLGLEWNPQYLNLVESDDGEVAFLT